MAIAMKRLRSYLAGAWADGGDGAKAVLVNPATEEPVAEASTAGLDLAGALAHARSVGGPALRELTFAQRGELLRGVAKAIHAHRDELIGLALINAGNTRGDAKFDIDGAAGTLGAYADLAATLGDKRVLLDGEGVQLGRSARFFGQHVLVPREGVAVHVNAFNFPAWGLAEKAACAWLAGMPVVSKPATATAWVAHRITEIIIEEKLLPAGALALVCGAPGDLLEHLGGQDVLAFTGSGDTGARLRALKNVVTDSVRVNVEADSLNSAVLGPDVEVGSATWELFVSDVARDITQKAGQKCTAIRRVLVPEAAMEAVREALIERLGGVRVGDPADEGVTMGPLATAQQLRDVRAGLARLQAESDVVHGGGAVPGKGYFVPPTLLAARGAGDVVHAHEVFGPVATLLQYDGAAEAAALVRRGGGGLVSSVYSDDRAFLGAAVFGIAAHHGRVFVGSGKLAGHSLGPGTVLPQLQHGGPGRAGGGAELGGLDGLGLYQQRVALQGDRPLIEALTR